MPSALKKTKFLFKKRKISHHLVSPQTYLLSIFSEASSHTVDVTLAPSPQPYTQLVTVFLFQLHPLVAHQQLLNEAGATQPSHAQDIGLGTMGTIEMTNRGHRDVKPGPT